MPVHSRFTASILLTAALGVAGSAAAAPPPAAAPASASSSTAVPSRAVPTAADGPLQATLAGEFALQAGRLDAAADWYMKAAESASADAGLAERATRISLFTDDDARSARALALWKKRAPATPLMRQNEAILAMRRNDLRAARRLLGGMLRDPAKDSAKLAVEALGNGPRDPAQAATLIDKLLDDKAIPASDLQVWLRVGALAQKLGETRIAERIIGEIIQRFPDEPRVALLRTALLREAGKRDEALAALKPVADSPGAVLLPELRLAVAAEYDALGETALAEKTLALGSQDDQSWRLRAGLLARAEDKDGLTRLYAALKTASAEPNAERRLLLGQTAEYLKLTDEALAWYASVPAGAPRAQARLRTAKLMHDSKRTDEAYRDLRELQSDAGLDEDARMSAYLLEAELRLDDKDAAGELDAYARGLAAFPDASPLLYSRALMWERRDDIARAEADLRRVLVAEPNNVAALNALGYTLADRTTRYAEALQLIDRARVAEPDNAAIVDSHGWVLYRLGRKKEALVALRRAYALQKDPEIAAHLGEVLWVLGNKDEARRFFDESRKLDPDNRSLKRALKATGA